MLVRLAHRMGAGWFAPQIVVACCVGSFVTSTRAQGEPPALPEGASLAPDAASAPGPSVANPAGPSAVRSAARTLAPLPDASGPHRELERWTEQLQADEVEAYCEHVRAAQESEQARLRSPWVSARGSTLQRGELVGPTDAVNARFRVGLGFSPSDWLQANLLEEHAGRSCDVYRAQAASRPRPQDVEAITLDAWRSKAQVLSEATAAAQELLGNSEAELQTGDRTISQHLAVLEGYQRLQQQLSEALSQVARLSAASPPKAAPTAELDRLRSSVSELEAVEGALRRNRALSFSVEGGYDEIVGAEQSLPVYGQVALTFRPGYFWQHAADERSAAARARAAALQATASQATLRRARLLLEAQRPAMEAEAQRLRDFLSTLKRQQTLLSAVVSTQAKLLSERLWFEIRLVEAEVEQLDASLRAMRDWAQAVQP